MRAASRLPLYLVVGSAWSSPAIRREPSAPTIRDAAYHRLVAVMDPSFKATRKVPIPTLQADQVPQLGVFLLQEQYSPQGDYKTGPPRFNVDATYGFSVVDLASAPSVLDGALDALIDQIQTTLLTDPTFVDLFEGVSSMKRTYEWFKDGETYYAEARLQMNIGYAAEFLPATPNALQQVAVRGLGAVPAEEFSALFQLPS